MSESAIEFLQRRLVEVENTAKAAEHDAGSPWRTEENCRTDEWDMVVASTPLPGLIRPVYELWSGEGSDGTYGSAAVASHVAAFDPAMVLQLVAATRAVLELHTPIVAVSDFPQPETREQRCSRCCDIDARGHEWEPLPWPCPTLRAVAAGWGWIDG